MEDSDVVSINQAEQAPQEQSTITSMEVLSGDTDVEVLAAASLVPDEDSNEKEEPVKGNGVEGIKSDDKEEEQYRVFGLRPAICAAMALVFVLIVVTGTTVGIGHSQKDESSHHGPTSFPTIAPTSFPTFSIMTPTIREEYILDTLQERLASSTSMAKRWWKSFDDNTSPQSKALAWMVDEDAFSAHPEAMESYMLVERFALAVLYFATDGPNWTTWGAPYLDGEKSVCEWNSFFGDGVRCDHETKAGAVTHVSLTAFGLTGSFPREISLLEELVLLDLGKNLLSGTITNAIGDLKALTALSLRDNMLHGSIPKKMSNLQHLKVMRLESNILSGTIPTEIAELSALTGLNLKENRLHGQLPPMAAAMKELYLAKNEFSGIISSEWVLSVPNITHCDCWGCHFNGTIPSDIEVWDHLTHLDLQSSDLSGSLPTEIGLMQSLTELDLFYNRLSGSLPTEIGLLQNITELNLRGNALSGPLPSEIGLLQSLSSLNLSYYRYYLHDDRSENRFSGTIPSEIGLLQSLIVLDLSDNHFSGSLPSEIGSMQSLRGLYLYKNLLSGPLPTEIGLMQSLIRLDLWQNLLSGPLPSEIGTLSALEMLSVFSNIHLTGTVPNEFVELEHLSRVELENTGLTGSLNSIFCIDPIATNIYIAADCKGTTPEIECSCCDTCCENNESDWECD